MASIRPFLSAAAALSLTLVACGGDDGTDIPVPEGDHYQYVVNKAHIPKTANEATRTYGLDLGSDEGKLDGSPDNQLGSVLALLASQFNFDIQGTIDEAVATGSIILLVDFQTTDFVNSSAAGLTVLLGDDQTATPPPCNQGEEWDATTMTGCGRHLAAGTFTVAADSPPDATVAGKIAGGTFNGGPGKISLQIALGTTDALQLDLIGARAKASGITADGISTIVLAGAITESDLNNKVLPAVRNQITPLIAEACTNTTPPDCGCTAGASGTMILSIFDVSPKDCMVTVEEIKNNGIIQGALGPDVVIDGVSALSLGIGATATKATFPAQ